MHAGKMPAIERPPPPAVLPGATALKLFMTREGFQVALIKVIA